MRGLYSVGVHPQTSAPAARAERPAPPLWALAGVVVATWLGAFLFALPIGSALTALRMALNASSAQTLLVPILFLVGGAVGAAVGWLVGRTAPNAVAIPGVGLMALGLLVTAFAPTITVVLAGRVLTGLGAGLAAGAAVALVRRVAAAHRTVVVVVSAAVAVAAVAVGWLYGGVVGTATSIRLAFLLALPVVLLVAVAVVVIAVLQQVRPTPR